MSAGTPTYRPEEMLEGLRPFRFRAMQLGASRVVLIAAAVLLAACFSLLWLDTVWALPAAVRWAASRGSILVVGCGCLVLLLIRLRTISPEWIARRVDQATGSGGEMLTGLQLATRSVNPPTPLSSGLANIASQRAAKKLGMLNPVAVLPWDQLKRPAYYLASISIVVALVALVAPSVTWNQVRRFWAPYDDVPPYTGIMIELELEKPSVLYGQDALVRAHVEGGRMDRVQLVVQPDQGSEMTLPMLVQNERTFQAILTRVKQPLSLFAKSGASRSRRIRLDVTLTPQLLAPKVVVTPPEYTRTAPYVGPIPEKGISGLVGTRVRWEVSSNRPLSSGILKLTYRDGEEELVSLTPFQSEEDDSQDSEKNRVGGFTSLSKPGQFELSVVDIEGTQSVDRATGSILITEDRRPVVRIVQPQPMSIATPDVELPVVVMADDDYGITKLTLFRSLNGSPATAVEAETTSGARVQQQWTLSLPKYKLQPEDEIQLFARTEDNDPAGAKGAESPITHIKIISVQEFQELMVQQRGAEMLQAKYQAARRHLENLAEALKEVEKAQQQLDASSESEEAQANLQQKLEDAKQAAKQAAQEIDKLSKQAMPIDVDQELSEMLAEMGQQAGQAAESIEQMQQSKQAASQSAPQGLSEEEKQQIREMIEQMKEMQDELTESAINPLQAMQKALPLMMDQHQFVQLADQQKDLAMRMKALQEADPNDPATQRRVAELEVEQEQLKQQLDQLIENIERHADELPPNPETDDLRNGAREFAQALRESNAIQEMFEAQSQLLEDKFSEAQAAAQRASEILESMLSQCDSVGDKACENCKSSFNPSRAKLGNSIDQLKAMMGMKPGRSGMKPGGNPGQGMGFGAGSGYSARSNGPKNIGMYGSVPTLQQSSSRGRGDRQSSGVQTSQAVDANSDGNAASEYTAKGTSSGQEWNSVPANYRTKVADYFRNLSEKIGDLETGGN